MKQRKIDVFLIGKIFDISSQSSNGRRHLKLRSQVVPVQTVAMISKIILSQSVLTAK